MPLKTTLSGKVKRKATDVAKKSGLTPAGVQYKRDRGETDEEILAGHGKRGDDGESLAAAQLRKEKAIADRREIEVAQLRGDLVERKAVELAGASMAQMTRQRVMTIPNTLAPQLRSMTDEIEIRECLRAECVRQLQHISNDFLALQYLSGSSEGDSPSAETDGNGVG